MELTIGLLIPFLGTSLGSAMVFLMKNKMNRKVEKLLLGFASGVMIAASVWSLLIPSIEMTEEQEKVAWIPASVGFLLGIIFLLVLDSLIPHLHLDSDKPEGAIISMPLKSEGMSKTKSFIYGTLSGAVEPIAAFITIMLTSFITHILPYLLSFAAGAMIYVVVEELIPESQSGEHSNIGTIGVAIGFVLMMILDVALG